MKNFQNFESYEILINEYRKDENYLWDILQKWINQFDGDPDTVKRYFNYIKQFLHYRGIKLHPLDIKQNLKFPKKHQEELYPLELGEFKIILENAKFSKKLLYLAEASSGMRIGELIQIRKKDLVLDFDRIMVKIPAKITKLKRARTTFFSSEVSSMLLPKIRKLSDSDLVFGVSEKVSNAETAEIIYLERLLKRLGLDDRYPNGRFKISTHSFRSYFITQISRNDPNLTKYFAGQKGYLLQYYRLTDKQKLEYYLDFEADLLVYDMTKKDKKIQQLQVGLQEQENIQNKLQEMSSILTRTQQRLDMAEAEMKKFHFVKVRKNFGLNNNSESEYV